MQAYKITKPNENISFFSGLVMSLYPYLNFYYSLSNCNYPGEKNPAYPISLTPSIPLL